MIKLTYEMANRISELIDSLLISSISLEFDDESIIELSEIKAEIDLQINDLDNELFRENHKRKE